MDKCSQIKKFHHDCQNKFYMYAFMYIYSETMPEGATYQIPKHFLKTTGKSQLQDQS